MSESPIFACPICNGRACTHFFDEEFLPGYSFSLVECVGCGLVRTWPLPTAEFLKELYSLESYQSQTVSGTYCLDPDVNGEDFEKVLRVLRIETQGNHLMDVGCGAGLFASKALAEGWDVQGVEPSPYACGIGQARLPGRIHQTYLGDASFPPASFDALTIWYVLEHVPDPVTLLKQAFLFLRPGGVLFTAVPNARYVLLRRHLMQLRTGQPGPIHAHEHLYQYTPKTLKLLLRRAGFEFFLEQLASPFMVSGSLTNLTKRVAWVGVNTIFRLTGINLGGIMIFSRKPG